MDCVLLGYILVLVYTLICRIRQIDNDDQLDLRFLLERKAKREIGATINIT